jgi:hypothetical protein
MRSTYNPSDLAWDTKCRPDLKACLEDVLAYFDDKMDIDSSEETKHFWAVARAIQAIKEPDKYEDNWCKECASDHA